jgi:CcmD family protein
VQTTPLFAAQAAAQAPAPAQNPAQTTAEDRSQAFRPVEAGELRSGEVLLVEAYAAIWAIVFVFILLSWRRQRSLDARVGALEGALERARRERDKGAG